MVTGAISGLGVETTGRVRGHRRGGPALEPLSGTYESLGITGVGTLAGGRRRVTNW
jgi:hypothetical protein